jgi:phosphoglycolate phosphatase
LIGPPLRSTLRTLLETENAALVERAVTLYRERYATDGWFENTLYEGIATALGQLQGRGHRLWVATSKAQRFAERILAHFALAPLFAGIHGTGLDGAFDDKGELLARLLETRGLDPADTLMIGDREHDAQAARRNGVRAIGVAWGFGSEDELRAAGVVALCRRPIELPEVVRNVFSEDVHSNLAAQKHARDGCGAA